MCQCFHQLRLLYSYFCTPNSKYDPRVWCRRLNVARLNGYYHQRPHTHLALRSIFGDQMRNVYIDENTGFSISWITRKVKPTDAKCVFPESLDPNYSCHSSPLNFLAAAAVKAAPSPAAEAPAAAAAAPPPPQPPPKASTPAATPAVPPQAAPATPGV